MVKTSILSVGLLLAGLCVGSINGQLAPQQSYPSYVPQQQQQQPQTIGGGRYFVHPSVSSSAPVPLPAQPAVQPVRPLPGMQQQRQPLTQPRPQQPYYQQQPQTQPFNPYFQQPQQQQQQPGSSAAVTPAIPTDAISQNLVKLANQILSLQPGAKVDLDDYVADDVVIIPAVRSFGMSHGIKEFAACRKRWNALFDVQGKQCQVISVNPLRNSVLAQCTSSSIAFKSQPLQRVDNVSVGVLMHFNADDRIDLIAMVDQTGGRFPEMIRAASMPFLKSVTDAGFEVPTPGEDDDDDDANKAGPFQQPYQQQQQQQQPGTADVWRPQLSRMAIGYTLAQAGLAHGLMLQDD